MIDCKQKKGGFMQKIYVKIDGIHCNHCKDIIENALLKKSEIVAVKVKRNIASISYEGDLQLKELIKTIIDLGYETKESYISTDLKTIKDTIGVKEFVVILLCILLAVNLLKRIIGFDIFSVIPTIDSSITYGMLVITGMFTSIHCISMCGAINLTAVIAKEQKGKQKGKWMKPVFYNAGRVLSYTVTGGIVGLLGSVININEKVSGLIIIVAAIIMFLMALQMLGIIDFSLPRAFPFSKINIVQIRKKTGQKGRSSFVIGLLNGLMPCGPLQAMQVYALSTGSAVTGAISMFLFGIGTVPLMLLVGVIVNYINGKRRILIHKVASVLILVLSIVMLNRGLLELNIDLDRKTDVEGNYIASVMCEDYQMVEFDLTYNGYADIIVQKDVPVRLVIHADKQYLTGCNNEVVFRDFHIQQELTEGDNIIEFTPTDTGIFTYTCWMNMLKNHIKVIDEASFFEKG